MEQGFRKLKEDKRKDSIWVVKETGSSNLVVALPRSPLGSDFFSNPFFLILPNLLSYNMPIAHP